MFSPSLWALGSSVLNSRPGFKTWHISSFSAQFHNFKINYLCAVTEDFVLARHCMAGMKAVLRF